MWPFSDRKIAERSFERIVIRVPNPLGDQIMATPALRAIRERYPKAHIAGHGGGVARAIYSGAEWFDDFIVSGRREPTGKVAAQLREGGYDACLLLTGSFRSALPPFLARIPTRFGYRRSGRTPLLTAHYPRPKPGGQRAAYPTKQYYLDLVSHLGAKGGGRASLPLSDEDRERTSEWLASVGIGPDDPILPMGVGAAFGPSKLWPAEYFAAVSDYMTREYDAKSVLLCGPGEAKIGAAVAAAAKEPLIDTGPDPLPLEVTKALIARSRVMLTNDAGPRHIAIAFEIPVLCLMGPTDPAYTDSDLEGQIVLREPDIDCSPCHLKVCPIDHRCMTRLTPDKAIAALGRLWGQGVQSPPSL
jgi:heptosyltransferase-2